MVYMIRTQLYSVLKSKRLLLTLLFAPALLLFCSYNASNSWIPSQYVLAMFAALISMLSSEILHWLMIDEIKDGLLDIILISPISRWRILIGKLAFPAFGAVILAFISLAANNFLSLYSNFAPWIFSVPSSMFLLFGAAFFALLELVSLLLTRKSNTNIHFLLLAVGIFLMLWLYRLISTSRLLFYTVAVLLVAFLVLTTLVLLNRKYQASLASRNFFFPHLFGNGKTTMLGAFFRKNLSTVRYKNNTVVQFVIAVIAPVLLGAVASSQTVVQAGIVILLSLSSIPSVVNIHLILYSTIYENRNKTPEILQIQGYSTFRRILEKTISAGALSSVFCAVSFFAASIFCRCNLILLPLTIGSVFLSGLFCSIYSLKIESFKGENIHKTVISMICIVLQGLIAYILI